MSMSSYRIAGIPKNGKFFASHNIGFTTGSYDFAQRRRRVIQAIRGEFKARKIYFFLLRLLFFLKDVFKLINNTVTASITLIIGSYNNMCRFTFERWT